MATEFGRNGRAMVRRAKLASLSVLLFSITSIAAAQVSGTTGYVPMFTGNSTIGNSSAPIFVNSSNGYVGIGNTNPLATLDINGGLFVRGYTTTDTGASYANDWTELGDCTITAQYSGCNAMIQVIGGSANGNSNGDMSATINWRVKQQAALGSAPFVEVDVGNMTGGYMQPAQFVALTTTNTSSETDVQLWAQITDGYEQYTFSPTIVQSSSTGQLSFYANQGFSSSLPSGTQTAGNVAANVAGSATAPSITFTGDTGTGLFQPASNVLGIATNGVERLRIDSSGNVGIGTNSPAAKLQVAGGGESIYFGSGSVPYPDSMASGNGNFVARGTYGDYRLAISDGNGRVNQYYNAYYSSTHSQYEYQGSDAATRLMVGGSGTPSFDFYGGVTSTGATTGTPGEALTWKQMAHMNVSDQIWLSPRGTNSDFFISYLGKIGIGTNNPARLLEISGDVQIDGNLYFGTNTQPQSVAYAGCTGGDYAESMEVTGVRTQYAPGDVLVLDAENPGKILKSTEPYSTTVAGIYSTKPGTVGRRQTTPKSDTEVPMALVGVVPTKVTDENGPIKVGDLLVSSSTPGVAMKGTDPSRMMGAVIGKAMGPLDSGTGVIEVLVMLR